MTSSGVASTTIWTKIWPRTVNQRERTQAYAYPISNVTWKAITQPFQIIGVPPKIGSTDLAIIGSAKNIRPELKKSVSPSSLKREGSFFAELVRLKVHRCKVFDLPRA